MHASVRDFVFLVLDRKKEPQMFQYRLQCVEKSKAWTLSQGRGFGSWIKEERGKDLGALQHDETFLS